MESPFSLFQKTIARVMVVVMTMTSLVIPGTATAKTSTWIAPAPTGAALGNWSAHAANALNWPEHPGTTIKAPKDNFRVLGQAAWDPGSSSVKLGMLAGEERWITVGNGTIGTAWAGDLPKNQEWGYQMFSRFPGNVSYIFAAYSPENAMLHVEVHRVEKTSTGVIRTLQADFTPWHGKRWEAAGYFRKPGEIAINAKGRNPFANFATYDAAGNEDHSDPIFRNVSLVAAQTIVGMAMRHYGAMMGFMSIPKKRFDQQVKTSGSVFKKKITVTVSGFASTASWLVATPLELQSNGGASSSMCVETNVDPVTGDPDPNSCAHPNLVAKAGVSFMEWKGGNFPTPSDEELVYKWEQSKTAWTVAFFSVVLAAVTFGMASALQGIAGMNLGASASTLSGLAGSIHAISSTTFGSGGGLTSAQAGFFGTTGDGVLDIDLSSLTKHEKGVSQGIENRHIRAAQGHNLVGAQKLYKGQCDTNKTYSGCQDEGNGGVEGAGWMWRPDSYRESSDTQELRRRWLECQAEAEDKGISDIKWVRQCAAPKPLAW